MIIDPAAYLGRKREAVVGELRASASSSRSVRSQSNAAEEKPWSPSNRMADWSQTTIEVIVASPGQPRRTTMISRGAGVLGRLFAGGGVS